MNFNIKEAGRAEEPELLNPGPVTASGADLKPSTSGPASSSSEILVVLCFIYLLYLEKKKIEACYLLFSTTALTKLCLLIFSVI